ncbi:hypothetical protein AB3662_44205 [Sorangium cellulosum]|uniref:hypothetical protein n=1 Tax=Sorangium cellulosum TaxID=56 RepID=UPI003D9A1D61
MFKIRRLSHDGHKLGPDAAIQKEGGAATIRNSTSIPKHAEARSDAHAADAKKTDEPEKIEAKDEDSGVERPDGGKRGSLLDRVGEKALHAYYASSGSSEDEPELARLDLGADQRPALLVLAEGVMEAARKTIAEKTAPPVEGLDWWPYKSINKRNNSDEKHKERLESKFYPIWVNQRQMAYARVKKGTSQTMSMEELLDYGRRVEQEKVGNCFDLSALTTLLLARSGAAHDMVVDVVRLGILLPGEANSGFSSGDHAFVVLNPPPADENGRYPGDFGGWGDAIIVDPWANIACDARDFPERWAQKMRKWKDKGKEIDTVTATGAGTKPPDQHPWIDGIVVFEKVSVTMAPRPEPASSDKATATHDDEDDEADRQQCTMCSVM